LPILEVIPDWLLLIILALLVLRISTYFHRIIFGVSSKKEKSFESTATSDPRVHEPVVIQNKIYGDKTGIKERLEPGFTLPSANNVYGKMGIAEKERLPLPTSTKLEKLENRIRKKLGVDKVKNDVAGRFEYSRSRLTENHLLELDAQSEVLDSLKKLQQVLVGLKNHSSDKVDIKGELREKKSLFSTSLGETLIENHRVMGSESPKIPASIYENLVGLEENLKIQEQLSEKDPASIAAQRNVAISMSQLAEILIEIGNLSGAINLFEKSLVISERLAQREPTNLDAFRDTVVSLNRLGDALLKNGDIEAANKQFDMGLNFSQKLVEQDPNNVQAQRDVWFSLNRIGDMRVEKGNILSAVTFFEAGLQIAQRLADLNPKNVQAQRDLIVSLAKLGEVSPNQGWWARGFSICKRLSNEGVLPSSDSWMLDDLYKRSEAERLT